MQTREDWTRRAVYRDSGELLGSAEYSIRIYQEMQSDERGDEIPGLTNIVGWVDVADVSELLGDPLVLHLADGSRLDFFFASFDGRIARFGPRNVRCLIYRVPGLDHLDKL